MSDNDFAFQEVPIEYQGVGIKILFVWMGFIMVVATMAFGGGLASQMAYDDLVKAIIIGNVFLAFVSFISGYVGSKSRLSFSALAAQVFGAGTWKLAVLYIPISLVGWYAIEAAIFGNLVSDFFELSELSRRILMSSVALIFASSAYLGMRFMGIISIVLVPTVVLISIYALLNLPQDVVLSFGGAGENIDLSAGIAIVMSTWIFSILLVIPDLTRFVRRPVVAGFIAAIGVFIANSVALGIGAFAAAYTGEHDPSIILGSLGFVPIAILLSLAGIWSTNDNNMYSSALAVSRVLSVERKKTVIYLAILGAVIAAFNPAKISIMFSFLIFMGNSAPALGGVVLGSFLHRRYLGNQPPSILSPWLAWLLASLISSQLGSYFVIPAGILLGYFFWVLIGKVSSLVRPVE